VTGPIGRAAPQGAWYRRADLALLVLFAALTLFTTLLFVVPDIAPAVVNDRLDLAILTAALLVSASVSALAWSRGRVANDAAALLRGSGPMPPSEPRSTIPASCRSSRASWPAESAPRSSWPPAWRRSAAERLRCVHGRCSSALR
jgi:hypothetical protein